MKKLLTTLWIIIIAGSAIIAIQIFKPETNPNGTETDGTKTNENIEINDIADPIEETKEIVTEQEIIDIAKEEEEKTYSQNIASGDEYLANGYITKAIESYKAATIKNPNSETPFIKLGDAYLLNNDPQNAEETFKKAELLNPDSIDIKIRIVRSYLNQRDIEAAKNLVWELDETNPEVKYYKAIILILYKNFEDAKAIFQELVNETEISVPSSIKENSQKFLDSFTTFSYFTEGEEIYLQTLLAKSMVDSKEFEASIPLLYDIIDQKNNYRDAWIVLGYAYLNTDKILDSIDAFEQARSLNEEKPQTLFFLGLAYFANDEIDKAIYYIEAADKNGFKPKDDIYLKLGELYLLQEDYENSEKNFEKVLSLNTSNIGVFIRAIWLNIDKLDNTQKAISLSEKALASHPDEAMSYNLMGWALTAKGYYSKAKPYLEKALSLQPDFDAAVLNLGWMYDKQGLTTLAKEYYKKAYTLGSGNSISNLAAKRFNNITENELKKYYYQAGISAPEPETSLEPEPAHEAETSTEPELIIR